MEKRGVIEEGITPPELDFKQYKLAPGVDSTNRLASNVVDLEDNLSIKLAGCVKDTICSVD